VHYNALYQVNLARTFFASDGNGEEMGKKAGCQSTRTMIHCKKRLRDKTEDRIVNISRSIRRLANIFLTLFIALSAGLVYWQVVVAQQVTTNAYLTYDRQCTSETAPLRGNIYDSRGVLLAYSVKSDIPGLCGYKRVYTPAAQGLEGLIGYYISPQYPATGIEGQFNNYLDGQIGLTGLNNEANGLLHIPPQGDNIYLTIDSRIEKILVDNFSVTAPIDNNEVFPTDRGSVIVSDPSTGALLGVVSEPGYDANCVVNCSLDQLRLDFLAKGYDKRLGCAAPCTISQFQSALGRAGQDADCQDNNDCNLIYYNYLSSDPEQPLIFRPTQECYPPGSTYKTVTLMAALDSGTFQPYSQVFYQDGNPGHLQAEGPVTVRSGNDTEEFPASISNIMGYTYRFPVSLDYGFSHSDNIIFLQAGVKTGAATWLKYNQSLYIGQKIPFDLPVKVSTVTPEPQSGLCSSQAQTQSAAALNAPLLAEDSFGQGDDFVTPLQMMLVNNVAADNGKLMRPSIIQKIVDPRSQVSLQTFSAQMLQQVISQTTSQEVRDAMYGVSECGSGSLTIVQLSYPYTPWQVIGKTGTAQVPQDQGSTLVPADGWFITAGPYIYQSNQVPPITITAMKENSGEGAYANGPMLRNIYNDIFTQVMTNVHVNPVPPGGSNFCYNSSFLQRP
jgi:penicillin-binding protein A